MIAGSLVVLGGSAVIAQAVCNAVSPQSHTLTPHSYRYSYFSTFTHISRGRGILEWKGREEERGERRGQYSRVQSVDDDCVRLFRSDASVSAVILLFLFLLPSAYLLVPKGTH